MDELKELKLIVDAIDCKISELQLLQQKYINQYNGIVESRLAEQQKATPVESVDEAVSKKSK